MEDHTAARAAARRGDLMAIDSPSETVTDQVIAEANSPGIWGDDLSVAFLEARGGDPALFRIAVVYRSPQTGEARLVEAWDKLSLEPDDENYAPSVLARRPVRAIRRRPCPRPAGGRPDRHAA